MGVWTLDLQDAKGALTLAASVPFHGARISWSADDAGSIEVDLKPSQMSTAWSDGAGMRRVIANLDGVPVWAGFVTNVTQDGPPGDITYKASGLGLQSILEKRIVRFPFVITDTSANIVAALLDEIENVQVNGDMGFTMGTTLGTFPTRTRSYCTGAIISEEINALADIGRGFDWEVDAFGALNLWAQGRGSVLGVSLAIADGIHTWGVESDLADMLTNVTALGDDDQPFGPARVMARKDLMTAAYGRHEESIAVQTTDLDELYDAAFGVLRPRLGSMTRLTVGWLEGLGPFSFGDVWLQDRVTADLGPYFGNSESMKLNDITATLDGNSLQECEYVFEALVNDVDIINDDEDAT